LSATNGYVLVTGGAGYVGAPLCRELTAAGRRVRVLDVLLHGQRQVADDLAGLGVEVIEGDVRDPDARCRSLEGVTSIVHLAAIVGDPACSLNPEVAEAVNVQASRALITDARTAGVERFIFASTCSNYGRMSDPSARSLQFRSTHATRWRSSRSCSPPTPVRWSRHACGSQPSTASRRGCGST
jgi:nucleoside-diphosphate-sugar epimerase